MKIRVNPTRPVTWLTQPISNLNAFGLTIRLTQLVHLPCLAKYIYILRSNSKNCIYRYIEIKFPKMVFFFFFWGGGGGHCPQCQSIALSLDNGYPILQLSYKLTKEQDCHFINQRKKLPLDFLIQHVKQI